MSFYDDDADCQRYAEWYGYMDFEGIRFRITGWPFIRLQSAVVPKIFTPSHYARWTTEKWLWTPKRAALTLTVMTLLGRKFIRR